MHALCAASCCTSQLLFSWFDLSTSLSLSLSLSLSASRTNKHTHVQAQKRTHGHVLTDAVYPKRKVSCAGTAAPSRLGTAPSRDSFVALFESHLYVCRSSRVHVLCSACMHTLHVSCSMNPRIHRNLRAVICGTPGGLLSCHAILTAI
jgi:hypothetical protein